jgi:hypothetical protein
MVATAGSTSHDDIVDFGGIETDAILQAIEDLGENALRVHVVQGAGVFALSAR